MKLIRTQNVVEAFLAFPFLRSLDPFYPGICTWYVNEVIPNVASGRDILLLAKEDNNLIGMALGKKTDAEKKLRCIRVHHSYQNQGIGIKLIDNMIELLETDKPLCTVSEEMIHNYSRIFVNRYGFDLTFVDKGRYRPRKLEYQFNS